MIRDAQRETPPIPQKIHDLATKRCLAVEEAFDATDAMIDGDYSPYLKEQSRDAWNRVEQLGIEWWAEWNEFRGEKDSDNESNPGT